MPAAHLAVDGVALRVRWAAPGGRGDDHLTAAERRRAARFRRPADAVRFVTGRLLARQAVADLLGVPAGDVELAARCPFCGGDDHGRPFVVGAGCRVSIAHSAGRAVAVAAAVPVGVDVEHLPGLAGLDGDGRLAAMVARLDGGGPAADAAAVAERWTRLEALAKATGAGLAGPPPTPAQAAAARYVPLDLGADYRAVAAVLPAHGASEGR